MSILNLGMAKEGGARRLDRLLGSLDRDKVRDVTDRVLEGTRTIGERHENITSAIEDASLALGQLKAIEEGLERARRALDVEFESRREERLTAAQADAAIATLDAPNDRDRVGAWIRRFLSA